MGCDTWNIRWSPTSCWGCPWPPPLCCAMCRRWSFPFTLPLEPFSSMWGPIMFLFSENSVSLKWVWQERRWEHWLPVSLNLGWSAGICFWGIRRSASAFPMCFKRLETCGGNTYGSAFRFCFLMGFWPLATIRWLWS